MRAPRMAIERTDREAEPRVGLTRRLEVVNGVDDMIETARNRLLLHLARSRIAVSGRFRDDAARHFTLEKLVGFKN
jgi:hypothetical protein